MSKKRSRGVITLANGRRIIFSSTLPPRLVRLYFACRFVVSVVGCNDSECAHGSAHVVDHDEITNLIVTHQNVRKR
jgi:hypothetical protein